MVVQTRDRWLKSHKLRIRVLCEIGLVDTMRFVNQFTMGYGDYTAERDELFGDVTFWMT